MGSRLLVQCRDCIPKQSAIFDIECNVGLFTPALNQERWRHCSGVDGVAETSANATSFSIQSNLWDCRIIKSEIWRLNGNACINLIILKLAAKYRASHKSFANVQGICCLVNLACWIGSFVEWAFIGFLSNIATLWSVLISYIFTALPWDASKSYMCLFNFLCSLFECVCMHVWMWQWLIQLLPGQIEVFFF